MITDKERLTTLLLACVYQDHKDKTVIKINIDTVLQLFATYSYNLPNQKFANAVESLLNAKFYNVRISSGIKYAIVDAMMSLAAKMHVPTEKLIEYYQNHEIKEVDPTTVKNWRKEYYGSMDKHEKQALIEAMQGKLRPEVIEEIKKA